MKQVKSLSYFMVVEKILNLCLDLYTSEDKKILLESLYKNGHITKEEYDLIKEI